MTSGTAIECATFKARKKAFLFVNENNARLRLVASRKEAARLAKREPQRYVVGPQGWVKILLAEPPELELMLAWLDESHRAVTKS